MGDGDHLAALLDEQAAFYRAVATEYDEHALQLPGGSELVEALDAFRPVGNVLELACGPGTWTSQLLRHATEVTAVDASAEMLGIAAARVGRLEGEHSLEQQLDRIGWRIKVHPTSGPFYWGTGSPGRPS